VSVASESGVNIPAGRVHYGVTKAAQLAPPGGLAETTAGTGVTLSRMLAGPTASEGIGQFIAGPARAQGKPKAGVEAGPLTHARPPSLPRLRREAGLLRLGPEGGDAVGHGGHAVVAVGGRPEVPARCEGAEPRAVEIGRSVSTSRARRRSSATEQPPPETWPG
jgi:hypothetical protein